MEQFFLFMGIGICVLMLLTLYRVVVGPTVIDRLMGVNVFGTKTTVLLLIIGVMFDRLDMFIDISLAYALLNFIVTIATSRYFQHHKTLSATGYGYSFSKREKSDD